MNKQPTISFQNVSFRFGSETVLQNLSFRVPPQKHTVLKGESGSGKSTILKLLLGFLAPASGSITVDNHELNPREVRTQSAWLPQDLNLGSGTVQEVMEKPFSFDANRSYRKNQGKQSDTLQKLGLANSILDKKFQDLSTGQRQRVGLSICHLLDKPLMLLDEPTSSLDRASKEKAADLLLDNQKTVISTSHDPFWVDLADNVIALD